MLHTAYRAVLKGRPSAICDTQPIFPGLVNSQAAARTRFTLLMEFTGAGGGEWTIAVADGAARLTEGRAGKPDLVMSQSPETFLKTLNGMINPMAAMLTGEIKVKGWSKLPTFGKLFPQTKPDQEWPIVAIAA